MQASPLTPLHLEIERGMRYHWFMEKEVNLIIDKHFSETPKEITGMITGICNEVFLVKLNDKSVIIRMNRRERFLKGSAKNIPVFKSKEIPVPEILFEDYSKETIPYAYQVMTFIEGQDLGDVIQTLNPEQLKSIAREVSDIFIKLSDIPTNGKFGWTDDEYSKLVNSWFEVMEKMYRDLVDRNEKTGVVGSELLELASNLITKHKDYFDKVPSKFVFDDISAKNVIIKDGKFNGLVDLDHIMYGDFLEPIGRIKASWPGTDYGDIYLNAVMNNLKLNEDQRKMVTVYALLNRISWLSEIGIQFNQNTSTQIDKVKVQKNKEIIKLLQEELSL